MVVSFDGRNEGACITSSVRTKAARACDSIHPGGVNNTAMSNPTGAPLEEINKHDANVPLQRFGLPDEIARATLFLASDEASYYPGLPGAPF